MDTITKKTTGIKKSPSFDAPAEEVKEKKRWFSKKSEGLKPKEKLQKIKEIKKEPKQKKEKKKNQAPRILLDILRVTIFLLAFFSLSFSGAVFAYQSQYDDRALFGTKILGVDVGGKNKAEINQLLSLKTNKITLSFNVDGQEFVSTPEEAGIVFKIVDSANIAVQNGKKGNIVNRAVFSVGSLLYKIHPKVGEALDKDIKNNLALQYAVDDEKLTLFTQNLSNKFNVESQNAGLVMNGEQVQVIPAIQGRKIITASIKKQLELAILQARTDRINLEIEKVDPAILESETKDSVDAANAILNIPVSYSYKGAVFTPNKATIGEWIVFNTQNINGTDKLIPVVDAKKVYPYIHGLASKINIAAINKKVTIKNGAEQVITQEGKDGLAVDVDQASATTANNLSSGKAVNLELPTYTVKYKTQVNNIIVADWAKYIEVNLSAQKMCAYLAGGVVQNCWSVTTGQSGMSTPTGTFLIQRKSGAGGAPGPYGGGVCMPNPPSAYPLCGINYVSTFTPQGHAIHEAWWRSSFGGSDYKWNGSHGCVNSPYNVAKWIYEWAPIGTPVIVHY